MEPVTPPARRRSPAGIGLVEVVVALAVLAALGVPILSLLWTGTREAMISEDFILAEMLATRMVEEKLALGFEELDLLVPLTERATATVKPSSAVKDAVEVHRERRNDPSGYSLELAMTRVTPDLLSMEVTATWEAGGRQRKFALLRFRGRKNVSACGRPGSAG